MTTGSVVALVLVGVGALVGAVLLVILAAILWDNEDSHDKKAAYISQTYEQTLRQLDETGDFYARLYEYIDRRLDDESRRRRSG